MEYSDSQKEFVVNTSFVNSKDSKSFDAIRRDNIVNKEDEGFISENELDGDNSEVNSEIFVL